MQKPHILTGQLTTASKKPCSLHTSTKKDLLEYFENTYDLDEWLFTSINDEKYFYLCPDRLRLPLIFYYCHTAVVYINKLVLAGLLKDRVNEEMEAMFETGVDEMSWDDTENYRMGGSFDWPPLKDIVEYRKEVREIVKKVILDTQLDLPVRQDSQWWAIWMCIEHERIHLETSSVLIRELPISTVSKPKGWRYAPSDVGNVSGNPMIAQKKKLVHLGKDDECFSWGWDNEYGSVDVNIPAFEASKYLVTNREMLEFVKQGGYDTNELWSREGLEWKNFRQAIHPTFWVCNDGCKSNCGGVIVDYSHCETDNNIEREHCNGNGSDVHYKLRLMFDEVPLPMDWPAEVNYHEAKAFCKWKGNGIRLLTEAEHHVLRDLPKYQCDNIESDPVYCDGLEAKYNLNIAYGSSTPVNMYPPNSSGCCDTFGNVWVWTEDHFNGLPGFDTNSYYDDFSTPCFDGKHTVIMGGSWISTGIEASRFARFAFRRHFIQHAGFRLARTLDTVDSTPVRTVETPVFILETKSLGYPEDVHAHDINEVCLKSTNKQYSDDSASNVISIAREEYMENGAGHMSKLGKRVRSLAWEAAQSGHASRILMVGCRTGRLAFELSVVCDEVVACDTSARCIYVAQEIQANGKFHFNSASKIIKGNAELANVDFEVVLPEGVVPSVVQFKQLTWIPFELNDFSIVVNNILDRAQNPIAWILRSTELINRKPYGRGIFISKKWSSERLLPELQSTLQLVSEERLPSCDGDICYISLWKPI